MTEEIQLVVKIVICDWNDRLRYNNGRRWIIEELVQEAICQFLQGRKGWRNYVSEYLRRGIGGRKGHKGKFRNVGPLFDEHFVYYDDPPFEDARLHAAKVVAEQLTEHQQYVAATCIATNRITTGKGLRNKRRINDREEIEAIGMIAEVMQELPILMRTLPYPRLKLETTKMKKLTRARLGFCPQCGHLPPMGQHFCSEKCEKKYHKGHRYSEQLEGSPQLVTASNR